MAKKSESTVPDRRFERFARKQAVLINSVWYQQERKPLPGRFNQTLPSRNGGAASDCRTRELINSPKIFDRIASQSIPIQPMVYADGREFEGLQATRKAKTCHRFACLRAARRFAQSGVRYVRAIALEIIVSLRRPIILNKWSVPI
jgi:hypothetical protein